MVRHTGVTVGAAVGPMELGLPVMTANPDRRTTELGFVNDNRQRVVERTGLPGDHNQRLYRLHCENCHHEYGANGADIFERRCPRCQGGAEGRPLE